MSKLPLVTPPSGGLVRNYNRSGLALFCVFVKDKLSLANLLSHMLVAAENSWSTFTFKHKRIQGVTQSLVDDFRNLLRDGF